MNTPNVLARLIADALERLTIRPTQIVDQIPGGQIAPATGSSAGAVSLSDSTPSNLGTAAPGTASEVSRSDHVHTMPTAGDVGAEPALGTPATDGDILSSTVAGVRSWVPPGAALWHGHPHRISTAVTLPAHHSLWLGRLEIETGGSVALDEGAVLQLG